MINSLGKAGRLINASLNHIANGMQNVSAEEQQRRLLICAQCENYDNDWCRVCGCALRIKTAWATSSCPIGLWDASEKNAQTTQNEGCGGCGKHGKTSNTNQ